MHAVVLQSGQQELAEQVFADGSHGNDSNPKLGEVDAGAGRSAGGGDPDLVQDLTALARRDVGDGTAERVNDVHAEAYDGGRASRRSPLRRR